MVVWMYYSFESQDMQVYSVLNSLLYSLSKEFVSCMISSNAKEEEFSLDVVTKIAILSNDSKCSSRRTRSQSFT